MVSPTKSKLMVEGSWLEMDSAMMGLERTLWIVPTRRDLMVLIVGLTLRDFVNRGGCLIRLKFCGPTATRVVQ